MDVSLESTVAITRVFPVPRKYTWRWIWDFANLKPSITGKAVRIPPPDYYSIGSHLKWGCLA